MKTLVIALVAATSAASAGHVPVLRMRPPDQVRARVALLTYDDLPRGWAFARSAI
jgi:hypothetical protein